MVILSLVPSIVRPIHRNLFLVKKNIPRYKYQKLCLWSGTTETRDLWPCVIKVILLACLGRI
jgi:hypothetical protein